MIVMTNFEYLKTLDLENFSKELSEHFTSIDEEYFEKYLNREKKFCNSVIGYIVGCDSKYLTYKGIEFISVDTYTYFRNKKLTKDTIIDLANMIAPFCDFAIISFYEDKFSVSTERVYKIEHHILVHGGRVDDIMVRSHE